MGRRRGFPTRTNRCLLIRPHFHFVDHALSSYRRVYGLSLVHPRPPQGGHFLSRKSWYIGAPASLASALSTNTYAKRSRRFQLELRHVLENEGRSPNIERYGRRSHSRRCGYQLRQRSSEVAVIDCDRTLSIHLRLPPCPRATHSADLGAQPSVGRRRAPPNPGGCGPPHHGYGLQIAGRASSGSKMPAPTT